jgi:hypothetical protein
VTDQQLDKPVGILWDGNGLNSPRNVLHVAQYKGEAMAESEVTYIRECAAADICPACKKPLTARIGRGDHDDGVFCSLDCHATWHAEALIRRHRARVERGTRCVG